jgi:hypothetical protein
LIASGTARETLVANDAVLWRRILEEAGDKIFADGRRIDEAPRLAARDAIRLHVQYDMPVVVWRDGGIALVPPGELSAKASRKTTGRRRLTKRRP